MTAHRFSGRVTLRVVKSHALCVRSCGTFGCGSLPRINITILKTADRDPED